MTSPASTVAAPRTLWLAYGGLSGTMISWSLVPVFLKQLLTVLSPTELSFARFLLSGGLLLAWVLAVDLRGLVHMMRRDPVLLLLATVFGPLAAMTCFNFGIQHIAVGTAAVFAALEPLFTYLLAVLRGQELWKGPRLISILMALAGICLVVLAREAAGPAYWVSLLLVTLTPLIWSVNNILTKDLVARHSPLALVAVTFVLSSLLLLPTLGGDFLPRLAHMGVPLWLAMLYCVASTVVGFSIWYWSLRHLSPSTVAVSMYVIPVVSVAAGMVFLDEPLSALKAAGIAVVLLGLYLVNVRFR
jgi:O-acetylserine/cysteine efflux transporter